MNEAVKNRELRDKIAQDYEWGFVSDVEQEFAPKGLNEDTIRFISGKKGEPEWMLDWRLKRSASPTSSKQSKGRLLSPCARTRTTTIAFSTRIAG